MFPLNLYAHVRFLFTFAHETAGAARTRSSPRPLLRVACALFFLGDEMNLQDSGTSCRENAEVHRGLAERLLEDLKTEAAVIPG